MKNKKINIFEEIFLVYIILAPLIVILIKKTGTNIPIMLIILSFLSLIHRFKPKDLGLRIDNLKTCLFPYLLCAVLVGLGVILFRALGIGAGIKGEKLLMLSWGKKLLSSFLQEFNYRGYLLRRLKDFSHNKLFLIVFSSLLFAYFHLFFDNPAIVELATLTFVTSLMFSAVYLKYPNLLLITLLHFLVFLVSGFLAA